MELITGAAGKPHITPLQDSMWHRGIVGMENCVFNYFTNFEATEVSATQVRIGAGIGQLQGRYFCIEPNKSDNVTISNGTSGYRRTDTICVKITVNESEKTEAASWEVVKGTPEVVGPEWPAAPAIPQGELDSGSTAAYMAMYNVLIDGTSIYEIRPAYKTPSNTFELDPARRISSGDDLNDYTDFGCWLSPSATVTNTLKNCPVTGGGFSLRVMRGTSGGTYKVQEMIIWSGQRFFRAIKAGKWDAWKIDIGITKLWENASPSSALSPQTITIPATTPDDILIVESKTQSNINGSRQMFLFRADVGVANNVTHISSSSDGSTPYLTRRNIQLTAANQFNIGSGYLRYFDRLNSQDNSYAIILSVSVIKGVM